MCHGGRQLTEVDKLLSSGSVSRLLEVRVQAGKQRAGLGSDTVALVHSLGAVDGMELAVQLVELGEEAGGDAVLLVEIEGAGDGGITDNIAVGQVLGDDARAWLLLLCNLVAVAVASGANAVVTGGLIRCEAGGGGDGNVRGAELSVV